MNNVNNRLRRARKTRAKIAELKVTRLEVSFKMSQNKTKDDLDGVIAGLRSDKAIEAANNVELLRPDDKR